MKVIFWYSPGNTELRKEKGKLNVNEGPIRVIFLVFSFGCRLCGVSGIGLAPLWMLAFLLFPFFGVVNVQLMLWADPHTLVTRFGHFPSIERVTIDLRV